MGLPWLIGPETYTITILENTRDRITSPLRLRLADFS